MQGEAQRGLESGDCGVAVDTLRTGGRAGVCRRRKRCGSYGFPESGDIPVVWECVSGKVLKGVGDFKKMVDESRFKTVLRRIDHLSLLSRFFRA